MEREGRREQVYLKESLYAVIEARQGQTLRVGGQAGDSQKSCILSPKAVCWQDSLFFKGPPLLLVVVSLPLIG